MKSFIAKVVAGVVAYELIDYGFHWTVRKINTKIAKKTRTRKIQDRPMPGFNSEAKEEKRMVIKGFEGKEVSC